SAEPRLRGALDERYVAPVPGPRLVTLPSPSALAHGTDVPPKAMAEGVLSPAIQGLDAELVVLVEPFLAREQDPDVDALAKELEPSDVEHARAWGEKLGVDGHEELVALLDQPERDANEVARWSSRYALKLLESAGLDVVYDGEQQRTEMYAWAVAHADGFEWRGSVRAFDNKYYSKAAVVGPIALRQAYHNDEFSFLLSAAAQDLKVPITGAYTIADWSFDERYFQDHDVSHTHTALRAKRHDARRRFILYVERNINRLH